MSSPRSVPILRSSAAKSKSCNRSPRRSPLPVESSPRAMSATSAFPTR
jgi:hypothetical protein